MNTKTDRRSLDVQTGPPICLFLLNVCTTANVKFVGNFMQNMHQIWRKKKLFKSIGEAINHIFHMYI